ncbi:MULTISPECIES: SAM-dependent methyltransferase [Novosphingobium]|uniref:SAM-dependent methyltransferase n=1 Tax=Novosphingobium sp. ST904 TaxID=1684385 RepID=UPI0006C89097|nr:SAM-dependent methyltransferase [Novosphingobium sp. ST904]KPH66708.1 NodS family protein [Novosphingobium sp. ST904]TCM26032.1 nodulation protein S (NodS) [Novosphingobium sp. ST904]
MTRPKASLGRDYFESMFQGDEDPWGLESSPYEQAKYNHTLSALAGRVYAQGLEVGCAKGVLTSRLAMQCGSLLAIDVSGTALIAASARCAPYGHVAFAEMAFPHQAPVHAFDLVVLSEVVYYWEDRDIRRSAEWIRLHLEIGGDLLLVHWTGETDYPQSGDDAVAKLQDALPAAMDVIAAERCPNYRLDLWRRRAA